MIPIFCKRAKAISAVVGAAGNGLAFIGKFGSGAARCCRRGGYSRLESGRLFRSDIGFDVGNVRVLMSKNGSSELRIVVEGIVAGVSLEMNFEGTKSGRMVLVQALDGNHTEEHGFELY